MIPKHAGGSYQAPAGYSFAFCPVFARVKRNVRYLPWSKQFGKYSQVHGVVTVEMRMLPSNTVAHLSLEVSELSSVSLAGKQGTMK